MYTGSLVIYALVSASTLHKNISCSLSEGSPEQPFRLLELGLHLRFYLHHTVKSFRLGDISACRVQDSDTRTYLHFKHLNPRFNTFSSFSKHYPNFLERLMLFLSAMVVHSWDWFCNLVYQLRIQASNSQGLRVYLLYLLSKLWYSKVISLFSPSTKFILNYTVCIDRYF